MNNTTPRVSNLLFIVSITVMSAGALYFQLSSKASDKMPKLGVTSFVEGALANTNVTDIKGEPPVKYDTAWSKYDNTTYNYLFRYPAAAKVQTIQLDTQPKNTLTTEVSGPDAHDYVTFTTWVKQPNGDGYGRLATLPISTFAQAMRMKEVNTTDPSYPNKKVGNLEEMFFAGYRGFAMTINNYTDGHGSSDIRSIYLDTTTYKMVIQYSLSGPNAGIISKTFRFTK